MIKKTAYILGIVFLIVSFFIDRYVLQGMVIVQNSILNSFLTWFSYLGSSIVVLVFVTSLFLWEEKKREYIPLLWISFFTAVLVAILFKLAIARARPFDLIKTIPLLGLIDYSFPSGHATVTFAVLPILDREFPKIKWFWIGFVLLVAFSRIYTLEHYLSDVIAGALIGYGIGFLFIKAEERFKWFKKRKTVSS